MWKTLNMNQSSAPHAMWDQKPVFVTLEQCAQNKHLGKEIVCYEEWVVTWYWDNNWGVD